jgi:hypothetical protein
MTKIFVQIFVSALVSLGIISGFSADVREQARQTGAEVKAALREGVTSTVEAASEISANAGVQAGAEGSFNLSGQQNATVESGSSLPDLNLGNISTWFKSETRADVEADASAQGTGLETWFGIDLSASNGLDLGLNNSD